MKFINIGFDKAGGIKEYQNSLSRILNEGGIQEITIPIDSLGQYIQPKASAKDIVLIHSPNHAEVCHRYFSHFRFWLFLHGDYDFYILSGIRHQFWVDRIVCVNLNTVNELRSRWKVKNCDYLPPFICEQPAPHKRKHDKFRAVFVGRLERNKGAHLLQDISFFLSSHSIDHALTIVYTSTYVEQDVMNDIRLWAFSDEAIELKADLDHESTLHEIKRAHALLLPSKKEGYPLCVAEALSLGTIPIVSEYSAAVKTQLPLEYHNFITNFILNGEFLELIRLAFDAPDSLREEGRKFIQNNNGRQQILAAILNFANKQYNPPCSWIQKNAIKKALWKYRILRLYNKLSFRL